MPRVLVTGFNARAASPRRATRDTCFAFLLAEALRDLKYTVEHRDTSVTEDLADFDLVFVGIASPLAVSSNRTYSALAAVGRAWADGRLVLFLDDPDVGKILNGLDSVIRKPEQLTKPFFQGRVDYQTVVDSDWQTWLMDVTRTLRAGDWPTLLVPAFGWADVPRLLARLPINMQAKAKQVDLSAYMPRPTFEEVVHQRYWVTEEKFDSPWLQGLGVTQPIKHLQKMRDNLRVAEYSKAWGVLEAPLSATGHGWFSPRLVLAMHADAAYGTAWHSMTSVGPMFTLLPDAIGRMHPDEHRHLVNMQQNRFATMAWSRWDAQDFLRDLLAEMTVTTTEEVL
jgi:hypothetical protein